MSIMSGVRGTRAGRDVKMSFSRMLSDPSAKVQGLGNGGEQILREMKRGSLLFINFITAALFQLNLGQAPQES